MSGGLHGVGVSVVNALSEWLELVIFRDDKKHQITFKMGESVAPLKVVGDAAGQSTVRMLPLCRVIEIFSHIDFDFTTLEHRLRELAFLNSGVCIRLSDERNGDPAVGVSL